MRVIEDPECQYLNERLLILIVLSLINWIVQTNSLWDTGLSATWNGGRKGSWFQSGCMELRSALLWIPVRHATIWSQGPQRDLQKNPFCRSSIPSRAIHLWWCQRLDLQGNLRLNSSLFGLFSASWVSPYPYANPSMTSATYNIWGSLKNDALTPDQLRGWKDAQKSLDNVIMTDKSTLSCIPSHDASICKYCTCSVDLQSAC